MLGDKLSLILGDKLSEILGLKLGLKLSEIEGESDGDND